MALIRPIFAAFLALVLVVTGGTMALARGQTMVAGQIVICSGGAALTISVDADGQPVGPVHVCPDCALSLFDAPAAMSEVPVPATAFERVVFRSAAHQAVSRPTLIAHARGPPAL